MIYMETFSLIIINVLIHTHTQSLKIGSKASSSGESLQHPDRDE